MKQCMQNRIRHSVRSLSSVHQLSQIGAYNMKFTPKFWVQHTKTCNRVQCQVYAVVAYMVKSTTKFYFIFFLKLYAVYKRRASGEALIPTVIRTLQPALPKGLKGFHEKAHPEPKLISRA